MNQLSITSQKRFNLFSTYTFSFFLAFCFSQCSSIKNIQGVKGNVIAQSNFIFYGTVVKMNSSNIDISANGLTAIVRIDQVIDAVSPYEQMNGKEITVLLSPNQTRNVGEKQVFYTMGCYYGKTLGVKEIPNNQGKETQADLKEKIVQERITIQNDSLRAELLRAELVVQGIVIEANINVDKSLSLESEHNPEVKKAIIEIRNVLKGNINAKQIDVSYSSSDDVMWFNSPKLVKGQEGIFLLHLRQTPIIFQIEGYTMLDRRDFQPNEQLSLIQNLLKR